MNKIFQNLGKILIGFFVFCLAFLGTAEGQLSPECSINFDRDFYMRGEVARVELTLFCNPNPSFPDRCPVSLPSTATIKFDSSQDDDFTVRIRSFDVNPFELLRDYQIGLKLADISELTSIENDDIPVALVDEVTVKVQGFECSDTARIVDSSQNLYFDQDVYSAGETAVLTLEDYFTPLNPNTADLATIEVSSSTDPGGLDLTLRETGDNTRIFVGNVVLTEMEESGGNRLRVNCEDTLTAESSEDTDTARMDFCIMVDPDIFGVETIAFTFAVMIFVSGFGIYTMLRQNRKRR